MSPEHAIYQEHAPCSELQSWVAYYWRYWAPPAAKSTTHPIPPEAGITITVLPGNTERGLSHGPSTITSGPQRTSVDVPSHPGLTVCGVRFWPGTAPAFLNVAPIELVDRMVPTSMVAPRIDEALVPVRSAMVADPSLEIQSLAVMLDRALIPLHPRPESLDLTVLNAVFRLMDPSGAPSNHLLHQQAELSPRQFRRRFKHAVGLSPREFRRLRRIRATLSQAVLRTTASWIDLAAQHGYADQAHLCRELQRSSGRSPNRYRQDVDHIEHTLIDS